MLHRYDFCGVLVVTFGIFLAVSFVLLLLVRYSTVLLEDLSLEIRSKVRRDESNLGIRDSDSRFTV
jgi:hypothetical protein